MNPMRAHAVRVLADTGAFLRCDRGGALYVTDLPARQASWQAIAAALERAHLRVEARPGLLLLTPGIEWADAFSDWAGKRTRAGDLTRQLEKRRGMPVCDEETACWIEGVKRLELKHPDGYERAVRQAAAVALRKNCGGLMACCGLCLDLMGGNEA